MPLDFWHNLVDSAQEKKIELDDQTLLGLQQREFDAFKLQLLLRVPDFLRIELESLQLGQKKLRV